MTRSAFRCGFDRDLCRTALEDPDLGARIFAEHPGLEGLQPAEVIAGGRTAKASGPLGRKVALRLADALLDAGNWEEALRVLQDDITDFAGRDALRGLLLARAFAAAGRLDAARSSLAVAMDADPAQSGPAAWLAQGLGTAPAGSPAEVAAELCALGLPALAVDVLEPALALDAANPLLDAAFGAMRLGGPSEAVRLLAAMTPLYRAEGREASLEATLAVLEGGPDRGVEPESEGSSPRRLLLRACLAEACAAAALWPAAIRRFDYAGKKWREPPDSLPELARCVGRDLLDGLEVRLLPPGGARRIFDLFPYNGEAGILQLKLGEMAPWIERFVLVEADETFPGRPKPLHFQEDPAAAAGPYADRIVPVAVPRPPAHIDYTWAREFFQKDWSVKGLEGLSAPGDLVILSDADEILERSVVEGFQGDVASGAMRTFRYYLNCELISSSPLLKATVTTARQAVRHGWNYLRLGAIRYRRAEHLPAAGWHFTSIGDPQWLAYKMQCTAHEEWSYMDQTYFERKLPKMRKALGPGFERREIDESFPASIRASREALSDFIL